MKRLPIILLLCCPVILYANTLIRPLGVEDLYIATGGTGAEETAVDNGVTTTKIDAQHIKLRATGVSVEDAIGSGTGSGVASLDNTTMDNTTITNSPISGSTGSFTSLEVGAVDNTEFGYLNGVTSAIQTQFSAKAPILDPTFTNNIVVDNEVTALQYNSTGADNTHYINVANTGAPNSGTETTGDCYFDNTTTAWLCWDGDSWEGPSASTIHWDNVTNKPAGTAYMQTVGTNPTVGTAGYMAVDTTANQVLAYGSTLTVLDPVRDKYYYNWNPIAADNETVMYTDRAITINKVVSVLVYGGVSTVTWNLYHNTSRVGGNKVWNSDKTTTSTTTGDVVTSFDDATIPANSYIYWYCESETGTEGQIEIFMFYTVDRQ